MEQDGQAGGLEQMAFAAGEELAATPMARPDPNAPINGVVAEKILQGWLQNRYQTRYPLVLKLSNMAPEDATLVIAFAGDCLRMGECPNGDPVAARDAAHAWLASIGAPEAALDALDEPPHDPASLVTQLRAANLPAEAYAIAAHVLGRRSLVNRRFLDYLSARLEVPDEIARSINRRHAS